MNRRRLDTDGKMWAAARHAALQVEFLSNGKEIFLYANALYAAMMWGWGESIEERRKKASEEDELLML